MLHVHTKFRENRFSGGKCLTVVLTSPYVYIFCQSFDVIRLLMGL